LHSAQLLQIFVLLYPEAPLAENDDPQLVALTALLLRSYQHELAHGGDLNRAVKTRELVRQITRIARVDGTQPERILIHIKGAWDREGMKHAHPESDRWYQELIRLCLEEYYKPIPE
jgi:hypothetical protein